MKTTEHITIKKRGELPATRLYVERYSLNKAFGSRDVVILLPGGPGNDLTTYNTPPHSITEALLEYVDVLLFDPRGCGQSEPTKVEHCTMYEYADDVEAIRQHYQLDQSNFIVFGQSYGAMVATLYASLYSQHIKKLFLIGGVVNSDFLAQALDDLQRRGTDRQKQAAMLLIDGKLDGSKQQMDDYFETMGPLYAYQFKPGAEPPALQYNTELLNYSWTTFLRNFDFGPRLKHISCPTLILWGENEWIFQRQQIDALHQGITHCELKVYSQCGHMLWTDQWLRFCSDAKQFLSH